MNQASSPASINRSRYETTILSVASPVPPTASTGRQAISKLSENRPPTVNNLGSVLFRAAWLALLLGISLQIILTFISVIGGKDLKLTSLIAETASRVSWSLVTCVGLAMGMKLASMHLSMVGFAGFLAASVSFTIARSVQLGVSEALSLATAGGPFPYTVALIKGAEYAILGIALGWIARRKAGSILTVLAAGLTIGVVFTNIFMMVAALTAKQPLPPLEVIVRYFNEAIFPVGCSSVIFATKISDLFLES